MSAGSPGPDISFQVLSLSPSSWVICTRFDALGFLELTLIQYFLNFYGQQQSVAGSVWLIILQAGKYKGYTAAKPYEMCCFKLSSLLRGNSQCKCNAP